MGYNKLKLSEIDYGKDYQQNQLRKYINRKNNHWKKRIELAIELFSKYVSINFSGRSKEDIVIVDIGCSIGTFAIEFAKLGYNAYGIDFDFSAIKIAEKLAKENKVSVNFIHNDLANWSDLKLPPIDVAICFDIFEHLHDDELGSLLSSLKRQLSNNAYLIFHTFPTEFDYLFYSKSIFKRLPLYFLKTINQRHFQCFVKIYGAFYDILLLLKKGKNHKELIKEKRHCNPLSKDRLYEILIRSGFKVVYIDTSQLYPFNKKIQKSFFHQHISHRNLFGVAYLN